MTADKNKGIVIIEYNHLNLPKKVLFATQNMTGKYIEYVYDVTGVKLAKYVQEEGLSDSSAVLYSGAFIYESPAGISPTTLKFISQPEGYIEPDNQGGFDYVYQFKDIWKNTRLTFSDLNGNGSIDASTEILREQNYYPFGLQHRGYNNVIVGTKNNYKQYQGQEFTEGLGLNIHEWKYRVSYPDIGRFWQIDPLAEKYTYNSTYAFQENKMGMGVELEGLELKRFMDGVQDFLNGVSRMINEPLNVDRQMDKKGFNGAKRAEIAENESRKEMSQAAGQTAQGASDMIKGGTKTVGEALEKTGDAVTYTGIVTAQPEIVAAGETISGTGTAINAMVDISDGKPIENVAVESAVSFGFGKLGKEGVKATQKVANKEFVKSGKNKISESIIKGNIKVFEKIFENYVTPVLSPSQDITTFPVYGSPGESN